MIINTDDNLNIYPQAPDDMARPEIPTLIIKNSDGLKLIKDFGQVLKVQLIESDLKSQDLYQLSNLYASDLSGVYFTVILKDVVYSPYNAYFGMTEVELCSTTPIHPLKYRFLKFRTGGGHLQS